MYDGQRDVKLVVFVLRDVTVVTEMNDIRVDSCWRDRE